jgi:hypothetical protein
MRIFILALCLALAGTAAASDAASDALTEDLPVDASTLLQNDEVSAANIRNLITLEQLHRSITSGTSGLSVSFAHVTDLTDGTEIDPAMISGTAYFGPYPFEAKETDFPYRRFRDDASVDHGHATLKVGSFFESSTTARAGLTAAPWPSASTSISRPSAGIGLSEGTTPSPTSAGPRRATKSSRPWSRARWSTGSPATIRRRRSSPW